MLADNRKVWQAKNCEIHKLHTIHVMSAEAGIQSRNATRSPSPPPLDARGRGHDGVGPPFVIL